MIQSSFPCWNSHRSIEPSNVIVAESAAAAESGILGNSEIITLA
jgi:hypothetical protein